jgi:hypothetical protein
MAEHALIAYNPTAGAAVDPDLWLGTVIHSLCERYIVTIFPTHSEMKPVDILVDTLHESLKTILGDRVKRIDLGLMNGHYFCPCTSKWYRRW